MRSVKKVSSHVARNIEAFIEEDTRYKKHYTQDNDTSAHFKVDSLGPHTVFPASLPLFKTLCYILSWNCHQLPHRISLNLIDSLKSLPLKGDFTLGKSLKSQVAKSGL